MLELKGVSKTYVMGDQIVHALDGIDLKIEDGEFVAIIGPSGSGKSTLMNVIGCLDTPSDGQYILNGDDVSKMRSRDLADARNRHIGFVFQRFNLLGRMSALRNVEMPARYAGMPAKERTRRAAEMLGLVGLGSRMNHKPMELSGGQQQRVAIARSLINQPSILLADEPTGALDTRTGREIMGLFERLHRERGITIILVTHEPEVAEYAHRVISIRDGRIESDIKHGPRRSALGEQGGDGAVAMPQDAAPERVKMEKPPPPTWRRIATAGGIAAAVTLAANALLRTVAVSMLGAPAFGSLAWISVLGITAAVAIAATLAFGLTTRNAANPRRTFTTLAMILLLLSFVPIGLSLAGVTNSGASGFRTRNATATSGANTTTTSDANTTTTGAPNRRSGSTWTSRLSTQGALMLMNLATYGLTTSLLLGTLSRSAVKRTDGAISKKES